MQTKSAWDQLWLNAGIATMQQNETAYGLLEQGALAVKGERIAWIGRQDALAKPYESLAASVVDCAGKVITPGLIDCHTHLVYGGNRAREFELRLQGAGYEEIARAGGGIVSTVAATRAASEQTLYDATKKRLASLQAEGLTTVEIKSGYGLDSENENKQLRVARSLASQLPVRIKTTFLGAHALPAEYADNSDAYIDKVCAEMLPAAHDQGLVDAVDAFCEKIAFSPPQVERVFKTAGELGLPVKLHAEQLSNLGGAALAARYGALSADHLEYLDAAGVQAMAAAGTVAVLLPGAFYFLRETRLPPLEQLRQAQVAIALASDSNPGSSPLTSLLLVLNMACTLFRMTPEEALAGLTRNAAQALAMGHEIGTLEAGKFADFVLWDIEHPAELAYRIGYNPCACVVQNGAIRFKAQTPQAPPS